MHKLMSHCDQMGRLVRTECDKVDVSQGLRVSQRHVRETGCGPDENEELMGELRSRGRYDLRHCLQNGAPAARQ